MDESINKDAFDFDLVQNRGNVWDVAAIKQSFSVLHQLCDRVVHIADAMSVTASLLLRLSLRPRARRFCARILPILYSVKLV